MLNKNHPTKDELIVLVTIDGETSRDLDDALHIESLSTGFRLVVAVSDPTSHVQPGSELDQNARKLVATVYRRDRALARMLPSAVSEKEASLVTGKPRAMFLHDISLTYDLDVLSYSIRRKTMTIAKRLSHNDVSAIVAEKEHPLHNAMSMAAQVCLGLMQKRRKKGALVLCDMSRLLLANEEGKVTKLTRVEEVMGHIVVQESMVLANTLQANYMAENDIPAIYRNHVRRMATPPTEDLLRTLDSWMQPGGMDWGKAKTHFYALCGKASYAAVTQGHFALSVPAYLHGTSPLRRYPDLFNARQLAAHLQGLPLPHTQEEAAQVAKNANEVLTKREEERSKFFKEAISRVAQKAMDENALEKLTDSEIGQAIKLNLSKEPFPELLENELAKRIDSNELGEKNLGRFLCGFPSGAKQLMGALERLLQRTPERNITFLEMAKAAGVIDVYQSSTESNGGVFSSFVTAKKAEKIIKSTGEGVTKKESIQKAANGVLRQLMGWPHPVSAHAEDLLGNGEVFTKDVGKNFKGELLEWCVARKWSAPIFDIKNSGPSHAPLFTGAIRLVAGENELSACVEKAKTKKEAEARLSQLLLVQLSQTNVFSNPSRALVVTCLPLKDNPIGALQEWLQKNKMQPPHYAFESFRGGFNAKLIFENGRGSYEFEAWARTKIEAKKASATSAMNEQEKWKY